MGESTTRGAVLVTGISTGIGKATAQLLLDNGFEVLGTVRRREDGDWLRESGGQLLVVDLRDDGAVARAGQRASDMLGSTPLVGLVNNAGILGAGPIECLGEEDFRRVMEVNLFGVAALCRAFLPRIRRAKGRVVNISSVSGLFAAPFLAPYAASKFALEAFSDSLRRELRPFGCGVTLIEPGPIKTPIWRKAHAASGKRFEGSVYQRALERFAERARMSEGRGLPASRVAEAVLRAFSARRAPIRILVARRAFVYRLFRCLPPRVVDAILARR